MDDKTFSQELNRGARLLGQGRAQQWTNLGAAYLGNPVLATAEQQDKAIAAFERALECDPVAPHVAYNLGLIYRDRNDRDRAIHWFTRALQADPLDRDARRILEKLKVEHL